MDMKTKSSALRLSRVAFGTALMAGALAFTPATSAQALFATPEAATEALVDGIARSDDGQLKTVLGADYKRYIPDSASSDADKLYFLESWSRGHKIIDSGSGKAMLQVGTNGWTLPIPLAKHRLGQVVEEVTLVLLAIEPPQQLVAPPSIARHRQGVAGLGVAHPGVMAGGQPADLPLGACPGQHRPKFHLPIATGAGQRCDAAPIALHQKINDFALEVGAEIHHVVGHP
jgi:hypothetical protein